jgi:hypothetical protein
MASGTVSTTRDDPAHAGLPRPIVDVVFAWSGAIGAVGGYRGVRRPGGVDLRVTDRNSKRPFGAGPSQAHPTGTATIPAGRPAGAPQRQAQRSHRWGWTSPAGHGMVGPRGAITVWLLSSQKRDPGQPAFPAAVWALGDGL